MENHASITTDDKLNSQIELILQTARTYILNNIIKSFRSLKTTEFKGMHDMIIVDDAWIMPPQLGQEPIKLSQIKNINTLILIFKLLCPNLKSNSSKKLSVYEEIVLSEVRTSCLE